MEKVKLGFFQSKLICVNNKWVMNVSPDGDIVFAILDS